MEPRCPKPRSRCAPWLGWILALFLGASCPGVRAQTAQPPETVSEAVFRSQWVGPQADRMMPEQPIVPSSEREIEPITDWASKLREGLYYGSLRFRPGLGAGWEYSNRTSGGQETNEGDDNSPFLAPSLGLDYTRDFGPISLSLIYGGGYVYYLNPNFNTAQSGRQRNPLNQSIRMRLGHIGVRHEATLSAGATYGNGENIQVGGNTTTLNASVDGNFTRMITEFFRTGTYAGFSTQMTRYGDDSSNGSDLYSVRAGALIDWLATGKTTLGFNLEAGTSVQETLTSATTSETTISRQYVQIMATGAQSLTSKVLVSGGLGAGYVTDDNVEDAEYVGVRPVYQFSVTYTPSEKTSVRLYSNFGGVELVPSIGLTASWSPRETTSFALSIYQNQNFSLTSSSQFQVNRGFIVSANQRLFSKIKVNVSGGWQQTENRSLSASEASGESYDYAFLSGNIRWDLNDWLYWQTSLWSSTGNRYQGSSSGDYPETIASTGLNLIF